jgi:hypothetical protein
VGNNLYGDYGRDCESRDTTVSFMTVFGVLFSGVSFVSGYEIRVQGRKICHFVTWSQSYDF